MASTEQDGTGGADSQAAEKLSADLTENNKPQGKEQRGLISRFFGSFKRDSQTILTAGVVIWATIFLLIFWSSGIIDNLRPETPGIIHIEGPQIYTRERLVNDRFREQAWLEKQLAELEDRAELISSYRKDSIRLSAVSGQSGENAETDAPATPPADNRDGLEEELLVSADDSFNLQRNMRATIRRALIENQLDDRHDLGSNSLYQFNFGAAIVVGSRTRRIAAIGMDIEPVDPLKALDSLVGEGSVCAGLREFECAYLFDVGILEQPTAEEREMLGEYIRWNQLFQKWLSAENAAHEREADDIGKLLSSPEASAGIRTQMQPFFNNLNRLARQYARSFEKVTNGHFDSSKCVFKQREIGDHSIEDDILLFIRNCLEETNLTLKKVKGDLSEVRPFLTQKLLYVPVEEDLPENTTLGASLWGEFFRYELGRFNTQCAWTEDLVEAIEGQTASEPSQESTDVGIAPSASVKSAALAPAAVVSDPNTYRLAVEVESNLLVCITRSVVRDYGSHPFGQVKREELSGTHRTGRESGQRANRSFYHAQSGLSSIVVTSSSQIYRTRERTEFIGIASRYSKNDDELVSVPYPHTIERLNRTCSYYGKKIPPPPGDNIYELFGASGDYDMSTVGEPTDTEIGWNMLAHFICNAYEHRPEDEATKFSFDDHQILPIGLFRFIGLLSGNQRTFSYSVQPSGVFNLQRRDQTVEWSVTNLFSGAQQHSQISASGDTTEAWIEKQYRIIGFGAQVDYADDEHVGDEDGFDARRKAEFGWYVFPAKTGGGIFSLPTMESANIKLSALVSLPAWWEDVRINVTTSWRDPDSPATSVPFKQKGDHETTQVLRVDLPTRLEFIRNHFPNTAAIRPRIYQLHLPKLSLRACDDADIVLKGERLWRSTVVTLGSQKSSLIQVMPDMRGIIAHFDDVLPFNTEKESTGAGKLPNTVPVTVWTSEGQKSVIDTVSIEVPDSVQQLIDQGEKPCKDRNSPNN